MKLNIDLGDKGPGQPVSASEKKIYYPTINFEEDSPPEFPKEGIAKVRYKKVSSEEREKDGKMVYRCTLEIQKIISAEGESEKDKPPTNSYDEAGDALDTLAAEKAAAKLQKNSKNGRY